MILPSHVGCPNGGFLPFAVFSPALAGAAALVCIALPVAVHLLFRKRHRVVPWAAVRFLVAAERRHRRRVEQWLLLAVRACALLLPLLAMAAATAWAEPLWQWVRPGVLEAVGHAPRTHHVVVVDASLSMTATDLDPATHARNGPSRFDRARQMARDLVDRAQPGDGFSLVALGGAPQAAIAEPATDRDQVLAEIDALLPTHSSADAAPALALVADLIARSPKAYPRRQVTVLTDLQRSAWAPTLPKSQDGTAGPWQRLVGRADVAVVDLAGADLDNLAVVDLALLDPLPTVGGPIAVSATVRNFGRSERTLVEVALEVERPAGSPAPPSPAKAFTSRRIEALPPGEQATVTFQLAGLHGYLARGPHVLRAKLAEGDRLVADDSRALVAEVRDGLSVLVVDDSTDRDPLRRASRDLVRALAPPGAKAGVRPRALASREFADPALGDLTGIDCVFLCDVPGPTAALAARLEAHLRRGGAVVVGLGPNAAADREAYNRTLFADGDGLLPAPLGAEVSGGADDLGFYLAGTEAAFRAPPLAAFAADADRAGLVSVPFRSYVRLEHAAEGRGRRILSFVPARKPGAEPETPAGSAPREPDPAVVEWSRHRGRAVVYASTFNADWTYWPRLPSYLPFVHELLRFSVSSPDRHNLQIGDAVEEFFPPSAAGLTAGADGPAPLGPQPVELRDEAGVARFPEPRLSGLYRIGVGRERDRPFAVNVRATSPGGGSESDLRRLGPVELKALKGVQVVSDVSAIEPTAEADGGQAVSAPRPWGPAVARWLVLVALVASIAEVVLAWRFGPARTAAGGAVVRPVERKRWLRPLTTAMGCAVAAVAVAVLATWAHAESAERPFEFLPDGWRAAAEAALGVPAAGPGEGTRWRLERSSPFGGPGHWFPYALAALAAALVAWTYAQERRAVGSAGRVVLPALLRLSSLAVVLCLVLPQLRLAFDREGWPDVALIFDTSASMGAVDEIRDPAVRAKAAELTGLDGTASAHRLRLAQRLVTRPDADWLNRLLANRRVKVHAYSVAERARLLASADGVDGAEAVRAALLAERPTGPASRLGDGVQAVLKSFRKGSLAAAVVFTDGATTSGDDLARAGREADLVKVPLFLIGVGDARERLDLILSDLRAEEEVAADDEMVFQARLAVRGADAPKSVPLVLYEKRGGDFVERARTTAVPDPGGNPTAVEIRYVPTEPGERTYALQVPVQPGEADADNNRIERRILVEPNRTRVLYVEGYARYEYRFVKSLLEREIDLRNHSKPVDLKVVLLDASRGWADTDRSALAEFPTRDQLFEYDAVILGDVDPRQLPRPVQSLQDLADFVEVRGGGLLAIAGQHAGPGAFADTPLAGTLPVVPTEPGPPSPTPENRPIVEGYRLKPTPAGQLHPLLRFAAGEADGRRIAERLQPMYWFAAGYRAKESAEVLATHPTRPAEGGAPGALHPLVLQRFAGKGRVLFLGFDETWRWRHRTDEEHFNRFWKQAVRRLSRSRLDRVKLRTDQETPYRRDQKVTVIVEFPPDAPVPPEGTPVRVEVRYSPPVGPAGTAAEAETSTLQLAKVEGSRATYRAALTRTPEGDYRFRLKQPEDAGDRSGVEAKVLPPRGEMESVDVNWADLTAAANDSHGRLYTLATADRAIDDLPESPRVPLNQPCPPVPLWNQPVLFALLALLLAAEWLLRKRERLL